MTKSSKQTLKKVIKLILVGVTIFLFGWYLINNIQDFRQALTISPLYIFLIAFGQILILFTSAAILKVLVSAIQGEINLKQSIQITLYSTIVNFFGFLQSGVGLRGVILKKNHGVNYKKYTYITLVYYMALLAISTFIILINSTALLLEYRLPIIVTLSMVATLLFSIKSRLREFTGHEKAVKLFKVFSMIDKKTLLAIVLLTITQFVGSAIAYGAELRSLGAALSISSLSMYTAVSVLSIFFALTPGAIGIREGMLLSVQEQIGLSNQEIIFAAVLDRSFFFILLFFCFLYILPSRKKLTEA